MSKNKMNGIIISENNLGDFDKMLTILTPNIGKISCVAKGARRPKSALLASTQLFCFGEFVLYKGTNTYHINSAEIIEMFYNLRCDLDKLECAIEINKIINEVTTENQNSYLILQLYLNTLYIISETNIDLKFVKSVFKLRLSAILGFRPMIEACSNCGEKNDDKLMFFSIENNGFACEVCGKIDKSAIKMSKSTLNAIKYTMISPAKKLYSFNIKNEGLKEYNLISKLFFEKNITNI